MNVSVFGLGYVGCVTLACLSRMGHRVIGIDINPDKVRMVNGGRSPIIENEVGEWIEKGVASGQIVCTEDAHSAVLNSEISLICVGTPSRENGSLDLHGLTTVSQQIGEALRDKLSYHCVVLRSTVLPGTVRRTLIPILVGTSGKRVDHDFDVCFNPEFLREGSAVYDYYHPSLTVVGHQSDKAADLVAKLYKDVDAPVKKTDFEVAEMLKYCCNSFHALKVAFANEIGRLCKSFQIDSHEVMQLFSLDKKLNISSAYLRPGFAFGGSCLPKDLRALIYSARLQDEHVPLINSIMESNRTHISRAIGKIIGTRRRKIGVIGMSFKPQTDDLRESPAIDLIEALIGKGFDLKIYDSDVSLARIFGANKRYIEEEIPHISTLLCQTMDEVIDQCDVIVICKSEKGIENHLKTSATKDKIIFDLVRLDSNISEMPDTYDGLCW